MSGNGGQRWAGIWAVVLLGIVALPGWSEGTYTVQKGDGIYRIAQRLGLSWQSLLEINGLTAESIIRPGQELRLPAAVPPETPEEVSPPSATSAEPPVEMPERCHEVVAGDSLWRIARHYGVSVAAVVTANDIRRPGFIYPGQNLVIPSASAPKTEAGELAPNEIVAAAMKYRGVPYRYAGMSSRGMDCSGLVVRVLRSQGVDAPHNSKALYKLGTPVPREDLRPGDLVFFHTTRPGISHVGIYVADGQFIHASSSGGKVRLDRIDKGYYYQRFVGAKRVG